MSDEAIRIQTPIDVKITEQLRVGDKVLISGKIYCGRDAVLPKIQVVYDAGDTDQMGIDLEGAVIFHTAVSPAGVGPTSSNKLEIESSIGPLSEAGVRIHLGKGALKRDTVNALNNNHSVYAVIPPVTALLEDRTLSKKCLAFQELGMEAFYEIEVNDFPAIIAVAHGRSIYE